jgi:hypothetical protein
LFYFLIKINRNAPSRLSALISRVVNLEKKKLIPLKNNPNYLVGIILTSLVGVIWFYWFEDMLIFLFLVFFSFISIVAINSLTLRLEIENSILTIRGKILTLGMIDLSKPFEVSYSRIKENTCIHAKTLECYLSMLPSNCNPQQSQKILSGTGSSRWTITFASIEQMDLIDKFLLNLPTKNCELIFSLVVLKTRC